MLKQKTYIRKTYSYEFQIVIDQIVFVSEDEEQDITNAAVWINPSTRVLITPNLTPANGISIINVDYLNGRIVDYTLAIGPADYPKIYAGDYNYIFFDKLSKNDIMAELRNIDFIFTDLEKFINDKLLKDFNLQYTSEGKLINCGKVSADSERLKGEKNGRMHKGILSTILRKNQRRPRIQGEKTPKGEDLP